MPEGNFALYFYHDDPVDIQAQATIEKTSQPMRGEFLRAAAISGAILHRIDMRLPSALAGLFSGKLQVGQFSGLLALLSGEAMVQEPQECAVYPWEPGVHSSTATRRRFSLVVNNEDENSGLLMQILNELSSRRRNSVLREFVIAGCALYELDPRFVKLLSSMPEPPLILPELRVLAEKLTGTQTGPALQKATSEIAPAAEKSENSNDGQNKLRKNMRRIIGG